MAEEKMQNPYEKDGVAHSEIVIGRGAACMVIALFVLILLLPPLYRNVYEATSGEDDAWVPVSEAFQVDSGKKVTEHLKEFEGDLEGKATFTDPPRKVLQGAMTGSLREGNRKTYVGKDGWLYLQAALDAMTGYGPITPEPDSVAKDPNRKPWSGPLGAIATFAAQLEELGVELVLVPIPVKPMIYPENIAGGELNQPLEHRDAAEFYQQVAALPNAKVIDLKDLFWKMKAETPVFLKQDTHWTPAAMAQAAIRVAEELGGTATRSQSREVVESIGDLAEQLELPDGGLQWFLREKVTIEPVPDFVSDPTAEIVLLGDSFTNIYSSKSLNWGEKAGFAEHLSMNLGKPIDVIAKNGQASTGVRLDLAKRGRAHLKKKKTVVWAIAARDLFLSETVARSNNVRWDDVEIPDIPDAAKKPSKGGDTNAEVRKVTGTLVKKSEIKDPSTVTYKNAIFVSEYQVEGADEIMLVSEWAFQDKKLTAASAREVGEKVMLDLVLFDSQKELMREQMFDDYADDFERMRYWAVKAESPGAVAEVKQGDPSRANFIASVVCGLAVLLVAGLARRLARS